jgi:hypothetical protein
LRKRGGRRPLQHRGDALAVPLGSRGRALRPPADLPAGALQRLLQTDGAQDLAVDVTIVFDEAVFQTQLQRVDPEPVGDDIHLRLAGPGHLGRAETPVGAGDLLVGVGQAGQHLLVRDPVGTEDGQRPPVGDVRSFGGVGPLVPEQVGAPGDQCPVLFHARLEPEIGGMARLRRRKLLFPGENRLDRSPPGKACERHGDCLGDDRPLTAETAPRVGRQDADLVDGQAQGFRQLLAPAMRPVRSRPDGVLSPGGRSLGDRGVGLHGGMGHGVDVEFIVENLVGLGETCLHVPLGELPDGADVRSRDALVERGVGVLG